MVVVLIDSHVCFRLVVMITLSIYFSRIYCGMSAALKWGLQQTHHSGQQTRQTNHIICHHTISCHLSSRHRKAIQNKLCVLSQDFLRKEGASEAEKHTWWKNTQTFFGQKYISFHISQIFSLRIENSLYVTSWQKYVCVTVSWNQHFPIKYFVCVFHYLPLQRSRS